MLQVFKICWYIQNKKHILRISMFSAMIWGWAARGKVSKLETKGISSQRAPGIEGFSSPGATETKGTSPQRAPGIEGFSSPGAPETKGNRSQRVPAIDGVWLTLCAQAKTICMITHITLYEIVWETWEVRFISKINVLWARKSNRTFFCVWETREGVQPCI